MAIRSGTTLTFLLQDSSKCLWDLSVGAGLILDFRFCLLEARYVLVLDLTSVHFFRTHTNTIKCKEV